MAFFDFANFARAAPLKRELAWALSKPTARVAGRAGGLPTEWILSISHVRASGSWALSKPTVRVSWLGELAGQAGWSWLGTELAGRAGWASACWLGRGLIGRGRVGWELAGRLAVGAS